MKEKRWNLAPIYPAVDSPEFNADLEKLKAMLKDFRAELESEKPCLAKLVDMENEMSDIEETLGSYAYCNVSVPEYWNAPANASIGMAEPRTIFLDCSNSSMPRSNWRNAELYAKVISSVEGILAFNTDCS